MTKTTGEAIDKLHSIITEKDEQYSRLLDKHEQSLLELSVIKNKLTLERDKSEDLAAKNSRLELEIDGMRKDSKRWCEPA